MHRLLKMEAKTIPTIYLVYFIVLVIAAAVFLSAFVILRESFKQETNLTLISQTLSNSQAAAQGEKLPLPPEDGILTAMAMPILPIPEDVGQKFIASGLAPLRWGIIIIKGW